MAGADRRRSLVLPHFGHSICSGALKLWIFSKRWPHALQRYSYNGTGGPRGAVSSIVAERVYTGRATGRTWCTASTARSPRSSAGVASPSISITASAVPSPSARPSAKLAMLMPCSPATVPSLPMTPGRLNCAQPTECPGAALQWACLQARAGEEIGRLAPRRRGRKDDRRRGHGG